MSDPLLVTARLASPLAGEAPRLDGLLEYLLSLHHPKGVPGYKIDRSRPAPPQGEIPIPLLRRDLGPWKVGCCSDPIYPADKVEYVEYINKRIAVEEAGTLHPAARTVVSTRNSWTKSYRLPLKVRRIDRVCWFALSHRRDLFKLLNRECRSIGKKISVGYGRIAGWEVERIGHDWTWFADSDQGPVLMATLPVGGWLPAGLLGFRKDFGAASPPYWHPDRYTEIVKPC